MESYCIIVVYDQLGLGVLSTHVKGTKYAGFYSFLCAKASGENDLADEAEKGLFRLCGLTVNDVELFHLRDLDIDPSLRVGYFFGQLKHAVTIQGTYDDLFWIKLGSQ